MHERYDYVTARVAKDHLPDVRRFLADAAVEKVAAGGGVLWGSWLGAGSIGWDDDQLVAMTAWPDGEPPDAGRVAWLTDALPGITEAGAEGLVATARPTECRRLAPGGVVAHRWFELERAGDFEELMTLSEDAWPAFEGAFDATIEGFFHSVDDPSRVLLVTRYASVAEWERSRGVGRADTGDLAEARRRFARRRELTRRQVVRIAALVANR